MIIKSWHSLMNFSASASPGVAIVEDRAAYNNPAANICSGKSICPPGITVPMQRSQRNAEEKRDLPSFETASSQLSLTSTFNHSSGLVGTK